MRGAIITVGDELLSALVPDSNSLFLEELLLKCGLEVVMRITVGDRLGEIGDALSLASMHAVVILVSGGLGPTEDDVTREAIAHHCKVPLGLHQEAWQWIEEWLKDRKVPPRESHKKQALFPKGAIPIPNSMGTAWGFAINKNERWIIAMPGVPRELRKMGEEEIIPFIMDRYPQAPPISLKLLKTFGMKESEVDYLLRDLERERAGMIGLMVKDYGEVHIRLLVRPDELRELEKEVRWRLGEVIFGEGDETLESVVGRLLRERHLTISTAESCTGGMLAHTITNVSGSSDYFLKGFVTYTDEAKKEVLGVPEEVLDRFAAVSRESAFHMVKGLIERAKTDIGISITGIAGPAGGSRERPVGLIYIGYAFPDGIEVREYMFQSDRLGVKTLAVKSALDRVRRYLIGVQE